MSIRIPVVFEERVMRGRAVSGEDAEDVGERETMKALS
jgi:hypothetical protein